jgi:hypothetical protein
VQLWCFKLGDEVPCRVHWPYTNQQLLVNETVVRPTMAKRLKLGQLEKHQVGFLCHVLIIDVAFHFKVGLTKLFLGALATRSVVVGQALQVYLAACFTPCPPSVKVVVVVVRAVLLRLCACLTMHVLLAG